VARLEAKRIEEGTIADDQELGGGKLLLDQGHGADKVRTAFFLDETADEKDDGIAGAGAKRVGGKQTEVDSDGEGTQLFFGNAAFEGPAADVIGDADEKAGADAESGLATEIDAAERIAAQGLVGHGGVVAVERDDKGDIELLLEPKCSGGVDGEMRVQQNGMAAFESANEVRGDAGGEEEMAAEFVAKGILAGEKDGFAVVEAEAGASEAEAGKARRVAAQSMCLGGDECFRGGQKLGTVNKDSGVHGATWGWGWG
jgi:hypothetical protein